ncbi:hypothetical protein TanjilG_03641 [Lupinus angustifolius]|uniref:Thioredoxin-like fold domain-containing protein n=1 Tax=Lupinus angustifolius TaxID=3871 RepID=A0A1J7GY20_LUPAN|nr:PREDICTED: uncharacterized protein LOC109356436 [Lupinus angustifolius]OIW05252.1 hypothetical protein TanjilG_03641 [Lupinus angustifolius]
MAPRALWSCFGTKGRDESNNDTNMVDETEENDKEGPVLVEMFTSQGCATSPMADMVLSRLGRGDFRLEMPVVLLAFHVDYWDYIGWKDPFGSSQWTVRQKAYVESLGLDSIFTPQVVVQGKSQCIGNDENALIDAITSAPRFPAPSFQATFNRPTSDSLEVSLTGALKNKVDNNGADVMVALYETGLVTDCPRGENKGRVLSNDYVVRKLENLCTVKDHPAKKTVSGTINFPLWSGFKSCKCGIAVFVQSSSHQILGSQSFHLPDDI